MGFSIQTLIDRLFRRGQYVAPARSSHSDRFRPRLQLLEDRENPATYDWVGGTSDAASLASNWTVNGGMPMMPPGANDDVRITGGRTSIKFAGVPGTVKSLTVTGWNGTVTLQQTLNVNNGGTISSGTFVTHDHFIIAGGTMTITGGTFKNNDATARTIQISAGANADFSSGTVYLANCIVNGGTLYLRNRVEVIDTDINVITNAGGVTNLYEGSFNYYNQTKKATFYNNGSMNKFDGGLFWLQNGIRNTGSLYIHEGTLNIANGITTDGRTGAIVNVGGNVTVFGGTKLSLWNAFYSLGGSVCAVPWGTGGGSHTAIIDFTQASAGLIMEGTATLSIGNASDGQMVLDVWGDVQMKGSSSLNVTLNYGNNSVDRLKATSLDAHQTGSSTFLVVTEVGTRTTGTWIVFELGGPLGTSDGFDNYNFPAGSGLGAFWAVAGPNNGSLGIFR